MAKLVVHFSNKIMTGSLYSQNEKSYENHGSKLLSIFSKTDPETLGVEVVHLFFQFAANTPGSDSVQVQVWWWSSITGQWHAGESPVADITESTVFTVESLGLERVYLQLKNPAGTFTLGAWAARVVPT